MGVIRQVTWLVVTEVRSASFGLMYHAQHVSANCFDFLVACRVTGYSFPFHIFCVYGMALCTGQHCSMRARIVCLPVRGAPGECYYNTLLRCEEYFSSSNVVSRAFCAPWVCSKFGHHPHSLGYLNANFRFFRGLHCWTSPWRKSRTQSLNQSVTQLIWWPGNRSLDFGKF